MTESNNSRIDFDLEVDRSEVATLKYDRDMMASIFGRSDLWPSWVADMDFRAAPEVQTALARRVEHSVYGYESSGDALPNAVSTWYENRHGWRFDPAHILFTPRTLTSISLLVELFSERGDGVIVQSPVFYDFKMIVSAQRRRLVKNPLKLESAAYRMDFEQLEALAAEPKNRLLILCNPHNPIGRVWPRSDLERLAEICAANDVLVIADEIHGDITYAQRYTPFASVSEEAARIGLTCISPVKSFNLAGVANSMIVVSDDDNRESCRGWLNRFEVNKNNVFTTAAMLAAYTCAAPWLDQVIDYLRQNVNVVDEFLQQRIPAVKLIEPEGTYLLWLDFRELGLDARELESFLVEQACIAGNPGHWFGREGAGFARINIACPRRILLEALEKLATAVDSID